MAGARVGGTIRRFAIEAATWLLFALGVLGGADILLFHSISHGIRAHAPARGELWSHACRAPVYAILFVAVPNLALEGVWYRSLLGLLFVDLAISVWDFSLEGESRASLGGLPPGEYLLHVAIAILFGALVTAIVFEGGSGATRATSIAWAPADVPRFLRWALLAMVPGVLVSGLLDLRAAINLARDRRRAVLAAGGRRTDRVP